MPRRESFSFKAVGYVRSASALGPNHLASLETQRQTIESYCQVHCLELIAVHTDDTQRDHNPDDHPGLRDALEQVCKHQGILVVYSLACLARSALTCIRTSDRLARANTHLASVTEKIDTTSNVGQLFFKLMGVMGNFELERERIAHEAPFGFDLTDDGDHIVLNDNEQGIIRRMVQWHYDGMNYGQIAQQLNDDAICMKADGRWDAGAVKEIIDHAPTSRWDFEETSHQT